MNGKGWVAERPDHRDFSFNAEERIFRGHQLPSKADLWPNVPPIWDQGQLGSCTAHGSLRGYLAESRRQGENTPMLSRLMQYFDTRKAEGTTGSDSGGTVRDAIKVLATTGVCPESEWPYDINKFTVAPPPECYADAKQHISIKYQSVTMGPGAPMRTAIANGMAIVFGFSVPQSFEDGSWNPRTHPLPVPGPFEAYVGGHCVAITGYDFTGSTRYFICDNSWGAQWGGDWGGQGCAGGRFALTADWFSSGLATDLWVISKVS